MNRYTGPWTVFDGARNQISRPPYSQKKCQVILDDSGWPIAELRMGDPEANARLMAAAPEMLELLMKIQKLGYDGGVPIEAFISEIDSIIEKATSAPTAD